MKKFNFKFTVAILALLVIFSGCGIKKMIKKYPDVKYKVEPEVLETNGGKIKVKVTGTIPPKYFAKNAMVEFKPVLTYKNGTTPLKTFYLKGEKASGDGQVINKKNGGTFDFTDVIDYKPDMNVSELKVTPSVYKYKKPDKSKLMAETKLADGVIYTSERLGKDEILKLEEEHGYKKEELITKSASLYFAYNKSNLDLNLPLNKDPQNKAKLDTLYDFLKRNWKFKSFEINAWASPEGELSLNQKLSNERGVTGDEFIQKFFKTLIKDKLVSYKDVKKDIPYVVNAKGEDFQGFMTALNASNIPDKNAIKNVIESQATKTEREQQIRNMTVIYEEVENILSVLRRAEFIATCYMPKKTDNKIAELSTTFPDSLTKEELLYAATLTNDLNTKLKIYENTLKKYPSEWKAYNNAGVINLELGKIQEAENYLSQANKLQPNNGKVLNNLGVLAAWNQDYKKAKEYYENAKSKGINVDYNLGVLAIKDGNYSEATKLFGNTTCTYNVALVKVLTNNYPAATSDLECLKNKDAKSYYLMAIIGARTNNTNMLYTNLKKAIAEDPAYKYQAKDDREFIKYFGNSEFQNIVQ
ncbi:MAG TPA: hypothetical protein P5250_04760 [Bacteroidales bacterium]|nr:hypothetical protein [Bacteroidales bacterium]